LGAELTKTHSFRLFFWRICPLGSLILDDFKLPGVSLTQMLLILYDTNLN